MDYFCFFAARNSKPMMNHDIFISYSSKQKSIADGVCHYLEENGFKCWMAPRDIPVGSEYGDLIEEAIKTSKVVVLVFSEAASISKWVKGEINVAFTEDKPILPFRVDETEVKGGFRVMLNMMHWIDAFPQYADRLPDLLSSICGLLGRQARIVNISTIQGGETVDKKLKQFEKGTNFVNGHEYVDLDLPSGTLWATCNVGANSPEDYGGYFSWDDGNKAAAHWGHGWRMPTKEEWKELMYNTSNNSTSRNGVKGWLFSASNGNNLFLPAAGYRYRSNYDGSGGYGHFWSSSLYPDYSDYAWILDFGSFNCSMCSGDRNSGRSVRAVRSSK